MKKNYDEDDIGKDEIWLGNTDLPDVFPKDRLRNLKTIRLGKQAYDILGLKLDPLYYRPIFIHKSEYDLYNKIMDDNMKAIRNGTYKE